MQDPKPDPRPAPRYELSVVIPAYNAADTLRPAVTGILDYYRRAGLEGEVIVVDDGSTDATRAIAEDLARGDARVVALHCGGNFGKGYAVRRGVAEARGAYIGFTDADLSYPIEQVGGYLDSLRGGADGAIGCRRLPASVFSLHPTAFPYIYLRHIIGHLFNCFVRLLIPIPFLDTQCGFKFFTRKAALDIFHRCAIDDFSFDVEALFLARMLGYRVMTLPVHYRYWRQKSSVSLLVDSVRMFRQLRTIRRNRRAGAYGLPPGGTTTMPGDYQHLALHGGNPVQRAWHAHKVRRIGQIAAVSGSDILIDAGCGSGIVLSALAGSVRASFGIDLNRAAVSFAAGACPSPRAAFLCADLGRLPFRDESISIICCVEVVEHLGPRELEPVLAEFDRLLRPGGRLLVTTPNYRSLWGPVEMAVNLVKRIRGVAPDPHVNRYTPRRLEALMPRDRYRAALSGSFNHFSPFAAPLSPRLAERLFAWESKPGRRCGLLLYAVFVKSPAGEAPRP